MATSEHSGLEAGELAHAPPATASTGPAGILRRARAALVLIAGLVLLQGLYVRYARLLRNLRPLATHLEKHVFPALNSNGVAWFSLLVSEQDGERRLHGQTASYRSIEFPGTRRVADALNALGVRELRLDTRLESGQIVLAFLLLLRVRNSVAAAAPAEDYDGWRVGKMAGAMLGRGLRRFCLIARLNRETETYEIEYSYCELLLARAVREYVRRGSSFSQHRVLFRLAPQFGILVFLLFLTPMALMLLHPASALASVLALAFFGAVLAGTGISAIGALQYSREHQDMLIQDYLIQIDFLSRFPEIDPNPIFKLDRQGRVLYANPSARITLEGLGAPPDSAELLPENTHDLVAACLESHGPVGTEVERRGRTFRYLFSPFPDGTSAIAVATDVSYLKRVEQELRTLNQHLEEIVAARTRELRETQDVTILSLAGLAETRDPDTGRHLERTRSYVKALAEQLRKHPRWAHRLDDETVTQLHKSVPLHDIGKVGVPDSILLKEGPLTEEEYAEMKRHTLHGGRALRWAEQRLGFDSFLRIASDIATYHHEWWNGNGYPQGLKGEQIPWAARLMALADVYDALTSARAYKPGWSHEEAREQIVTRSGSHFDPDVVEAFVAIEDRFVEIAREYRDDGTFRAHDG